MPLYEYECEACGHRFEDFAKMSDDRVVKCEECGKLSAGRMLSVGPRTTRGHGWAADGYSSPPELKKVQDTMVRQFSAMDRAKAGKKSKS